MSIHASRRVRFVASKIPALALALSASLGVAVLAAGCNQGAEGDRCNPDLSAGHDECGGGLKCTQPLNCPENYCCPRSGASSSPYCQAGCNGGLASICAANPSYDACAPANGDGSSAEAAGEAGDAATESGTSDAGAEGGG